ncbi:hypothetical protein ELH92_06415 [Rhizobium ruizarguesonis]|nr:hypothetical protein [Rhizobium leguminosarum bv. viciae]TAT99154.1 hypothetical protein ELI53_06305 [Rhizobium ruizarguesonis]NKL26350.1 hypothetical protein [Rhizobium leguminosarum bv. viciae]TAY20948.1 hypothetical protein ELH92_06415 [Rhizobium ruizarguesonis]TAZ18419.1 hypothetical protein ELH77_06305 [Rhizobium ruizarguesonis]
MRGFESGNEAIDDNISDVRRWKTKSEGSERYSGEGWDPSAEPRKRFIPPRSCPPAAGSSSACR